MGTSKIRKIIVKFLAREVNSTEVENLENWLKDTRNISMFHRLVRIEYLISLSMKKYNLSGAKDSIRTKLKKRDERKGFGHSKKASMAIGIVLLLCIALYQFVGTKWDNKHTGTIELMGGATDKAIFTIEMVIA